MGRALATIDYIYLLNNPSTPPLYKSGVVYSNQVLGSDDWLDIPTCLDYGFGACEDLAAWRVAELAMQGERAFIDVDTQIGKGNITVFHVVVKRADGRREDPSKILGMR